MNHYTNKKSLALLGHSKLKGALRHTLLLIGMVLVSLGAFAQNMTPVPEGLKMEKKWVSDDPTGRTGNILVEAFVTGHSVAQHLPTDIVLVLDVSGSMAQNMPTTYAYTPRSSQAYSYDSYGNSQYYYYYNGQYYLVERQRTGGNGNRRYNLHFNTGTTIYYLYGTGIQQDNPNVQGSGTTIWTGVLYTRTTVTQTKMQALQAAVGTFVDNIAADANQYDVDHRISVVKYAVDEFYGSEASVAEGNHRGASGSNNFSPTSNYNYTEVVINRGIARTESQRIKTAVNALVGSGPTAADYGMKKAQYVLAQVPANEKRSKVVVLFTDGDPNYMNGFDMDVANDAINNAYTLKHNGTINGTIVNFDAMVFTIGVFNNPSANTLNYMDYVSSNYLEAHGMNDHGDATPGVDYSYTAE